MKNININKKITIFLTYGIVAMLSACHPTKNNQPAVSIAISPLDKNHVKVEYTLPQHCTSIALLNPYEDRTQQLRNDWQSLDDCGKLSGDGIISKHGKCKNFSFRVPIEAKVIDRVNPVAYPIGDVGVLVHTGTFAVADTCGNVDWNFSSPGGNLIIDGEKRGEKTQFDQIKEKFISYTGVFFGYNQLAKDTHIISSESTPEKLNQGLVKGSQQANDYFLRNYPSLHFSPPTLFISNTVEPGSSGFQADISSKKMIRFGFFNWQENQFDDTRSTIVHEYAHILQPANFIGPDGEPIYSEGGAEFLRWMAEYRLGWRDKNYSAWGFSNALRLCLESSRNRSWSAIKAERNDYGLTPYTCGLVIHTIALASRTNSKSAEQNLESFYLDVKNNPNASLSHALECGDIKECNPTFLDKFFSSSQSTAEVIIAQMNNLGLIKGRSYLGKGDSLVPLSQKAFESLMIEDCGATDIRIFSDKFVTGKTIRCDNIPRNTSILAVEGKSYFSDSFKAIEAQNKGCLKNHKVTLQIGDNKTIVVPCKNETILEKNYYEIDIDRLFMLLGEGRGNTSMAPAAL